jgi:putative MATE family efflux protein
MKVSPPQNPWDPRRLLHIIGLLLSSASFAARGGTFIPSTARVFPKPPRRQVSASPIVMVPISPRTHRPSETDRLLLKANEEDVGVAPVLSSMAPPPQTTGQRILDLAIPAAAALGIDPLMNLVDTAFVGRFTSAVDAAAPLAGMGSATALLTFTLYLFNFLCTTTTPLVARQRASGNEAQAVALGGQVLSLALLLGTFLTLLLWGLSQPLLHLMGTGNTGVVANDYATVFLVVRAAAAPAVLCMEASTGILRGYLDTQTPIAVLVLANLVNLLLDIVLVVMLGLGPMGAAIATTTAEWISALLFLSILAGKLPSVAQYRQRQQQQSLKSSLLSVEALSIPSMVPVWTFPSWPDVQPLWVASSSAFFRALVLQLSLSAAAALAARSGAPAVAAHQIGLQLWLLGSFVCDALAAAAQGLVADALGRRDAAEVVGLSSTICRYSGYLGLLLALLLQLGTGTHWLLDVFTNDADTRAALDRILPLMVAAQPLNALVFAADGVLQGAAEFPFQARAMALSGLTAVGTFVVLEAMPDVDTLVQVWSALIALQVMRGLTSLWKLVDRDGPINLLSRKEFP